MENRSKILIFIFIIAALLCIEVNNFFIVALIKEDRKQITEINTKIDSVIQENISLKSEIEELKGDIDCLYEEDEILREEIIIMNEIIMAESDRSAILEELSDLEWNILYRVARSEAGASSREGQMHVIYVVLNRMESERFSNQNTISEVVFAPGQFSVVENGSFYTVEVSEFTMENVHDAYINWRNGERFYNVLFFHSGTENPGINYITHDEVGHHFY